MGEDHANVWRLFLVKGGEGVFLRKIPRMLLIGFELGGGYLGVFARFCDTFCDVLARAERRGQGNRKDKGEAGFCGIPPLPQEPRHGKDGAPGLRCWGWRRRRIFGYFLA